MSDGFLFIRFYQVGEANRIEVRYNEVILNPGYLANFSNYLSQLSYSLESLLFATITSNTHAATSDRLERGPHLFSYLIFLNRVDIYSTQSTRFISRSGIVSETGNS